MQNQPHPFESESSHILTKIQVKNHHPNFANSHNPFLKGKRACLQLTGGKPKAAQDKTIDWVSSQHCLMKKNPEGIAVCAAFICGSVVHSWTRVWAPSSSKQQWPSYLQRFPMLHLLHPQLEGSHGNIKPSSEAWIQVCSRPAASSYTQQTHSEAQKTGSK